MAERSRHRLGYANTNMHTAMRLAIIAGPSFKGDAGQSLVTEHWAPINPLKQWRSLTRCLPQCDLQAGREECRMSHYDELVKVMKAVAKYREDESLPKDPQRIDRLCERLFAQDGFDEVAVAWKHISTYEREVHGGDWPKAD